MDLGTETPRRRHTDTSNGEARRAVQATLQQFAAWRLDIARFSVEAERRCDGAARRTMLRRCAQIENELHEARVNLLIGLADAPDRVAGHSRVVDVERALDNVELAVTALRGRLAG